MSFPFFKFVKDTFFKNFFLKVISLLLAITIWFVLSSAQGVEKIVEVPVVVVNKPADLGISSDYVKSVLVQLRSTPLAPKDFAKNLTVTIDLKDSLPGERVFKITKKNLNLPSGVEVINIRPSTIVLKLEKLVKKKVPVVVRYSGMPAKGYEITNISLSPRFVWIEGPQSRVKKIKSLFTETISIGGLKTPLERSDVNVVINSPYINFVKSGKVSVIFFIEEKRIARYYRMVRIKVINYRSRYKINRLYVDVVVKVPLSLRNVVKKDDIEVYADLSKINVRGKFVYVPLEGRCIKYRGKVLVDKIYPDKVRIKIY